MRMQNRGLALSTVLFVVFALLLFGLSLGSLVSFQYQITHESVDQARALEAAQSGLAQSIYNLSNTPTWGKSGESASASVAADGSHYDITFDTTSKTLPWSVNNLQGSGTVPGFQNQVVPPYSALMYSTGSTAGPNPTTRVVEALVQYSTFPYAIAASNQVTAGTSLNVNGAPTLTQLLAGDLSVPGSVYASSTGPQAIVTGSSAVISGKVRTPGGAQLGSGSQVIGGIETGIQPDIVPNVDITSFSDRGFQSVTQLAAGTTLIGPVTGAIYCNGNLNLVAAVLANAYIYLDNGGNLTSTGTLAGTGSLYVTGTTAIEGNLNIIVNTGIAVFSQGDLSITGGSIFQGVLYSHGTVSAASGLKVLGGIIAQSNSGTGGNVVLQDGASVSYVGEYTQFGNSWSTQSMNGSAVNGTPPLMKTLYWKEIQ